jgi:plastocyanin
MHRLFAPLSTALVISTLLLAACAQATPAPEKPKAAEPRTLTVQVGAGQETEVISAFLPSVLRIRAGDTVVWKLNSDEAHTVTFNPPAEAFQVVGPVPGGKPEELMILPEVGFPTRMPGAPVEVYNGATFASSGMLSHEPGGPDAPPNDTFALTFDQPGVYPYLDLLHAYQTGIIIVEPATATDVPSQADIDAQVQAQLAPLSAQVQAAKEASMAQMSAPAPDGSTLWFVNAGNTAGNPAAGIYAFGPQDVTINAGDTVIWASAEFHTITFDAAPPAPEFVIPQPTEGGLPVLAINPEVLFPAKPAATYDPTQYYNSSPIGPGLPGGTTFTLTFDEPGTYEYFCAVHRELGMKGTITVK